MYVRDFSSDAAAWFAKKIFFILCRYREAVVYEPEYEWSTPIRVTEDSVYTASTMLPRSSNSQ